jgi:hypothetical protein
VAENSKRERLIKEVINRMKTVPVIDVVRRAKQTRASLQEFALPQFPIAAVVGGLPKPVEKKSSRRVAGVDLITSTLPIEIYVYDMYNQIDDDLDSKVSSMADDIWKVLYAEPTYGGLAIQTLLTIQYDPEYWDPFLAFNLTVNIKYLHTTEGI